MWLVSSCLVKNQTSVFTMGLFQNDYKLKNKAKLFIGKYQNYRDTRKRFQTFF